MSVDDLYTFTPTVVLNTRLNWLRNSEERRGLADGFDITKLGFSPQLAAQSARLAFPEINLGAFAGLGSSRGGGIYNPYDNFQFFSSLSKITGQHSFKFGADVRMQRRNRLDQAQSAGTYTFGSDWTRGPLDNTPAAPIGQDLGSFLLGLPTGGGWDTNAAESSQNWYAALFMQDDFRVRQNLTLNLGIRYERELPTTERYNR